MLLRNYFIFSDDKIIVFFYCKQKLSIKNLQRFCQIIPIVQIICLFTFCSLRNHFQTIREFFLIEIYLQCMYKHKFISDLFLLYPQNMRCLMKFDLLLVLMLHYVFCFKIKILYHSEFSRFFLTIFYKNMHIGEIYYVLQHSTDYR